MNPATEPSALATPPGLASIDAVTAALASAGYISTRQISTAVYLAHHLRKPVLIEGPAGVGKTELAVSAARAQLSLARLVGAHAGAHKPWPWVSPRRLPPWRPGQTLA